MKDLWAVGVRSKRMPFGLPHCQRERRRLAPGAHGAAARRDSLPAAVRDARRFATRTENEGPAVPTLQPQDPEFEPRVRASFARQRCMLLFGARIVGVAPGRLTVCTPTCSPGGWTATRWWRSCKVR